jgi:N-methylhydantoinase B
VHNNSNIPIEMIESDMPLTFLGYGLLVDSGGAGRQRGGLGLWREWRIDSTFAQLSTNLDRFKFRPFGLTGGERALPDPRRQARGAALQGHERHAEEG